MRLLYAPYQGLLGLVLSTMTGMAIMPYVYNLGFIYFHFTTYSFYLLSFLTLGFLYLLTRFAGKANISKPLFSSQRNKYIATMLILPLVLLFFIAYPHIKFFNNKLTQTVITDSDKHFAMVTSLITSETFPPKVSFTRLTQDVPLRYYYFYYLLSASLIGGLSFHPHIPTVFACISSVSVGILLVLLASIAKSIFKKESAGLWALVIAYTSGLQVFNLAYLFFAQHRLEFWPADLDDMAALVLKIFATGPDTTPQHFFASGIFLLMVALILYAKNKKPLIILLALLHATLLFFSLYIFVAVTFAMILFGCFLLIEEHFLHIPTTVIYSYFQIPGTRNTHNPVKSSAFLLIQERLQSVPIILVYSFFFCLFAYPLYSIMSRAGDPVPILSVFQFTYVDFIKSPIFGQKRHISIFFGKAIISFILWYTLYFLERFGALLIGGIAGLWLYKNLLFKNKALTLLLFAAIVTYISIHFLKLPGPQNEYAKNATLLITYALGILMAGFFSTLFRVSKTNQTFIKHSLKIFLSIILLISVATGVWEYYFAVGYMKLQFSHDKVSEEMPEIVLFLHDTPRDTVVFSDTYLTWHVNNYAAKRVNLSPLGPYTLGFIDASNDWVNNYQRISIFDTGLFDKSLWLRLHSWHTKYVVMSKYDKVFPRRSLLVDKNYFREVLATQQAAIYEVE